MGSFATGLNQRQSEYASYAAVSEHWWLSCHDKHVPQWLLAYPLPRHCLGEAIGKHRAVFEERRVRTGTCGWVRDGSSLHPL